MGTLTPFKQHHALVCGHSEDRMTIRELREKIKTRYLMIERIGLVEFELKEVPVVPVAETEDTFHYTCRPSDKMWPNSYYIRW